MKKLILIYVFCSLCSSLIGQSSRQLSLSSVANTDNHSVFVTSKPNAVLYKLSDLDIRILDKSMKDNDRVFYADIYSRPKKVLRKPTALKVIAYVNAKYQMHFDIYIVLLNNKLYCIEPNDIEDNTSINDKNNTIDINYNVIKSKAEDLKRQIDSLKQASERQCQDSIDYYKRLKIILPAQIDLVENAAIAEYERLKQEKFDKWYRSQPASTKQAADRLQINYAELQDPNSAGGCDYELYYTNKSNKTIKYLHWTGTVYNAVGDLAYCSIRHYSTYTGRDTGPVKPNIQGGGVWSCIVYNYSADTVKLNNIRIDYMDGTSVTISSADIRRLMEAPVEADSFGGLYGYQRDASKHYRNKLESCDRIIWKWQQRKERLNREYHYRYGDSEYHVYSRLKELNDSYKAALADLIQFKRDNFVGLEADELDF